LDFAISAASTMTAFTCAERHMDSRWRDGLSHKDGVGTQNRPNHAGTHALWPVWQIARTLGLELKDGGFSLAAAALYEIPIKTCKLSARIPTRSVACDLRQTAARCVFDLSQSCTAIALSLA
jgi:hypothetical protein